MRWGLKNSMRTNRRFTSPLRAGEKFGRFPKRLACRTVDLRQQSLSKSEVRPVGSIHRLVSLTRHVEVSTSDWPPR